MFNSLKILCPLIASMLVITSCGGRLTTQPKPPVTPSQQPEPLPSISPEPNNPSPINTNFVELKILTYNVWGLPKPLTTDIEKRMANISTSIHNFDLVNLQETFSEHSNIIFDNGPFQHKVRHDNSNLVSKSSGLGTLSKYPIVKKNFKKFTQCSGSDCNSNKGVFFTRINVPNLGDIDLYNTHYQSSELKEDIRISYNKELEAFIKQNNSGNPTIITGDFNFPNYDATDNSSKSFKDFKKRFSPIDTFRKTNPQDKGFTNEPSINNFADKKSKPQRLDYIFVLPDEAEASSPKYTVEVADSKIVFNTPVNGLFLSDHFGLASTLRIYINK